MDNDERPKTPSLDGDDSMPSFPRPSGRRYLLNTLPFRMAGENRVRRRKNRETLKQQFKNMNRQRSKQRKKKKAAAKKTPDPILEVDNDYLPKTPSLGDDDSIQDLPEPDGECLEVGAGRTVGPSEVGDEDKGAKEN